MPSSDKHCRRGVLAPDPELWTALREGQGLFEILQAFYDRVFDDPRLAPFFAGVTKERAIDKQFLFLRSLFTGERVYFGNHPKRAHNWMVISDELFDYREELMMNCLKAYGLPDRLIAKWRIIEETFRKAIVKNKPSPVRVGGVAVPVDGYAKSELAVGGLCDECGGEIVQGGAAYYHRRTGKTRCPACFERLQVQAESGGSGGNTEDGRNAGAARRSRACH